MARQRMYYGSLSPQQNLQLSGQNAQYVRDIMGRMRAPDQSQAYLSLMDAAMRNDLTREEGQANRAMQEKQMAENTRRWDIESDRKWVADEAEREFRSGNHARAIDLLELKGRIDEKIAKAGFSEKKELLGMQQTHAKNLLAEQEERDRKAQVRELQTQPTYSPELKQQIGSALYEATGDPSSYMGYFEKTGERDRQRALRALGVEPIEPIGEGPQGAATSVTPEAEALAKLKLARAAALAGRGTQSELNDLFKRAGRSSIWTTGTTSWEGDAAPPMNSWMSSAIRRLAHEGFSEYEIPEQIAGMAANAHRANFKVLGDAVAVKNAEELAWEKASATVQQLKAEDPQFSNVLKQSAMKNPMQSPRPE